MRFHKYIILPLLLVLAAPAPSWASEATESKTIVVLGDSLTAGYGLDPAQAFPAIVPKKVDESGLKFNVINGGVSGDTSAGGLRRLDWLLKRKVDVLVIALGGNDGLRGLSPRAMRKNLQSIIDRTREKYPEAQIVIAGMRMPPNLGEYATEFDRVFPELARENKLVLVPFLLEGVGGKSELNLPDQIHPTAEGQKIIAENVWSILKPLLAPK
jgi:acyl-CoA thioesterase I